MTNWCYNWLTISGKSDEITRFKEGLLMDNDGNYHLVKSYSTKRCKEDVHTKLKKKNPNKLILEFESRWMPPAKGLIQIVALFPELDFYLKFHQPTGCIHGFVHWAEGEVVEHESEISDNPLDLTFFKEAD